MIETLARTPYNYVPFHTENSDVAAGARRTAKVLVRWKDIGELPSHDVIDPALKTGEIHVTLRAETPVFVSDGHGHFFKGANGKLMLPGSTIRGMIRENMQILGFGLPRPGEDLEDAQIYYRKITAATKDIPGKKLKWYYLGALGVNSEPIDGRYSSVPQLVKSGYLCREGRRYYIQPTRHPYIRVPRNSEALTEAELADGEAKTVPVTYTLDDGRVSHIRTLGAQDPGKEQGVLLYTGRNSNNARYLFPAADEKAERIWISEADRISYEEDYETRENFLKPDPKFWALPTGQKKPVFYLHHNGHTYFGMSLFLRIGYDHKLSEGLPDWQSPQQEEGIPLDYPHAILGFSEKDLAYRSRVSFGDFAALGDPGEGEPIQLILMQPKPSWYVGYVKRGKSYNEDGFRLRGYKLYWLKNPNIEPVHADRANMRPLPAETEFRGVIRYKNLHPDELGLLLWALRLEEGCYQSVGMGKPYGLGRMTLTIDRLSEYDTGALYRPDSLRRIPTIENPDSVAGYIRAFDEYICERLHIENPDGEHPSIRGERAIRDFFFMRREILTEEEAGYMSLKEYKSAYYLPSVKKFREKADAKHQTGAET